MPDNVTPRRAHDQPWLARADGGRRRVPVLICAACAYGPPPIEDWGYLLDGPVSWDEVPPGARCDCCGELHGA